MKEFNLCFLGTIGPFMRESLNVSFRSSKLSIAQKQAVMTLKRKVGAESLLKTGDQYPC